MVIKKNFAINEAEDSFAYRTAGSKNKSTLAKAAAAQQSPVANLTPSEKAELKDTVKKADKILDDPKVEYVYNEGQIEKELNELLAINEEELEFGTHNFQNLLLVGPAGTGKTSRVNTWAKAHGINLVTVIASAMDETDLGGILSKDEEDTGTIKKLSSKEFDSLETPKSVLFLDEFNRAPHSVRAPLLSLIQDHEIRDDRVASKKRFLKGFLFTVAAVNPADTNYNTDELDDAEKSRFEVQYVALDNLNTRDYLIGTLQKKIDKSSSDAQKKKFEGQQRLANKLLSSKKFRFDNDEDIEMSKINGNGLLLTARTFTNALTRCNGTKEDFLRVWDNYCNNLKKDMVIDILADYKDANDKATQGLDSHETESPMFTKRQSAADKLAAGGYL